MKKVTVFGAGSFGTAIAQLLASNCDAIALWGRNPVQTEAINVIRENANYLPGLKISERVHATSNLEDAVTGSQLMVLAVPSDAQRDFISKARRFFSTHIPIITVAKGIENETLSTMTEIIERCLPGAQVGVLSGPSFAKEVMLKMPTAVTVASRLERTARMAQGVLSTEYFRIYTSTDVVGVQVGGALKNVISIAAGISDGMGMGHNARAAIVTRGLAEMSRMAVCMGGNPLTLSGLTGMGDLMLTCTGELSRNRAIGIALGRGQLLEDVLATMDQLAEGIKTAKSAHQLQKKYNVELPICEQVYQIIYEGKTPQAAVANLMTRLPKSEFL